MLGYSEFFLNFKNKTLKISNIDMLNMNGIEFIEKVRTIDIDVPIIFIAVKSSANVLYKSIQIGVLSYILKPGNEEKIKQVLSTLAYIV